jgi:hypothetical protein
MISQDAFFHADALSQVFACEVQRTQEEDLSKILDLQTESELSFLADKTGIQEGFCLRMERRARLMAKYLIDDRGELNKEALSSLISYIEEKGYIAYPNGLCDAVATRQTLSVLQRLYKEEALASLIRKFQAPLCHPWAEELVRATLHIFSYERLTDAEIRRAALSAILGHLRQNVGSCFATAPAIVIQRGQSEKLLTDLYELLTTGKLKRTFGGIEFSVPLSPSSGAGELNKVIFLQENPENVCLCPGLLVAFAAIKLVSGSFEEKIMQMKKLSLPFLSTPTISMGDLIHKILLNHFHLQEEDLLSYEKITLSLAKTQGLMGGASGHLSRQKWQDCEQMLKAEKMAKAAFKSVTENALVKAWEFTIASYSEVKMEFSRWNLYSSLGMHSEEKGGVGEIVYKAFEEKLKRNNERVAEYQVEYEIAYNQLKATEALLKNASNESEARRLSAEFNSRLYQMQSCLEVRDQAHAQAAKYSEFFSFLMKQYNEKFQEYFQEIYDADMREIKADLYEDSPAGFRLVYKHGRSNASLWSMIYTADQYIEMLAAFFLAVEPQIAGDFSWDHARTVLSDITTSVVSHIRSQEFIDTAFIRMANAHGGDKQKKPWAYTSGGTMTTLLKTYYKIQGEMVEEARWVENATNLFVFILDVLKAQPLAASEAIAKQKVPILMSSPTHAFILHPFFEELKLGWQDDTFTYSWVRDQVINPRKAFYEKILLSPADQRFLLEELGKRLMLPPLQSLLLPGAVQITAFREQLVKKVRFADSIDSFLFEMLPLTPAAEWKMSVRKLLEGLDEESILHVLEQFSDHAPNTLGAKQIKERAKAVYMLAKKRASFSFDLHEYIAKKASQHGLSPPPSLLFADTNWVNNYFAFVVNPGTSQLELWRVDYTGSEGSPMSTWKRWLDGTDRKTWNLYPKFYEYS